VFIPKHSECAVDSVFKLIGNDLNDVDVHLLPLKENLTRRQLKHQRVIIFAHPDKQKVGFANSISARPIIPNDFDINGNLEVLGNVCFGSKVLGGSYWAKSISHSISFSSEIAFCTGTDEVNTFWENYFKNLIADFRNKELDIFYDDFRKSLEDQLDRLDRSQKFTGSFLVFTCISGILRNLTKHP
jgi:hypothetical protein